MSRRGARLTRRLQPGQSWVGEMAVRSFDSMWERPLFDFDEESESQNEPPPSLHTISGPRSPPALDDLDPDYDAPNMEEASGDA